MSRILITGGAGFIGSTLAEQLVRSGRDVVLLDVKEDPKNIRDFEDRVEYVHQDVRDGAGMKRLMIENEIGGVVHLAAVSRVIWGEQDPDLCIDMNVNGTRSLLDAMKNGKNRPWLIFGSSREVYGEPTMFPVCEYHEKAPVNVYGRTKLEGEHMIMEASERWGMRSAILRFSNVYGNERDILDRVIPRFVTAGLSDRSIEIHGGNQVIDFTHIDDTVNGIIQTINALEGNGDSPEWKDNGGLCCEDFHILPGAPITLQQAAWGISEYLGADIPINYTDPRTYDVDRFHGDPSKAERILGFKAQIHPMEGIRMTVKRFSEVLGS